MAIIDQFINNDNEEGADEQNKTWEVMSMVPSNVQYVSLTGLKVSERYTGLSSDVDEFSMQIDEVAYLSSKLV